MYKYIVCGFFILSDEKRFACSICPARFKDCSSCRRHVREHASGTAHICSVCSMPFKRAAHLKNHLQQQHDGIQATASSEFTAPANLDSTVETIDCADLMSSSRVNVLCYNSSSTTVFNVSHQLQSCDVIAEEAECSVSQYVDLQETVKVADVDPGTDTVIVSAVSGASDNSVIDLTDKSITQSLDYLQTSCSASESDLLFPQERTDSFPLPLPSLVEDSVSDVIATSKSASLSMVHDCNLSSLNRPDVADAAYLPWHVHFAEAMCAATVPLASDRLQAVVSIWSSLVSDMTTMMMDTSMSAQQQHYPALLDVVHKLSAVVELHLQILQRADTSLCHE